MLRHCYPKRIPRRSNTKPTLLRPYDENLLIPNSSTDGNWQLAELEVLNCVELNETEVNLHPIIKYQQIQSFNNNSVNSLEILTNNSADLTSLKYYECEVDLITGKTHQIRLQFSSINACIVGDTRYQPIRGLYDLGNLTAWGDGSTLFGSEPRVIGLQCNKLTFSKEFTDKQSSSFKYINQTEDSLITKSLEDDGSVTFTASIPWWRETQKHT